MSPFDLGEPQLHIYDGTNTMIFRDYFLFFITGKIMIVNIIHDCKYIYIYIYIYIANQETASVGTPPLGARVTPSGVDCKDSALAGVKHIAGRGDVPLDSSPS